MPATVANYRAAAEPARAADKAAAERVRADGKPSTKGAPMRSRHALPMLALLLSACAAKTRAVQPIAALAEQRLCPAYPLPPGGAAEAAGEDRLPDPDRLIATEQAIQLDELIKWVKSQAAVDTRLEAQLRATARTPLSGRAPKLKPRSRAVGAVGGQWDPEQLRAAARTGLRRYAAARSSREPAGRSHRRRCVRETA